MLTLLFALAHIFTCNHDLEIQKDLRSMAPTPLRKRSLADHDPTELEAEVKAREPIRVMFNYDSIDDASRDSSQCIDPGQKVGSIVCLKTDILNDEKRTVIKETMENARNYIHRLVNVSRRKSPIKVSGIYEFSETLKDPDMDDVRDIDLFIFVVARPYGETSSTLASASPVSRDFTNDHILNYGRPIVGQIKVNPTKLPLKSQDENSGDRQFFVTCLHELMHVLAFSSGLFRSWVNRTSGNVYTSTSDNSFLFTVKNNYNLDQTFLATPRLTEWINNRFQVVDPTLRTLGLEIEDGGSKGTAGSHPNSRLYFTDIMQGRTYGPGYFSPIYFHSLYDSGWYEPNYTMQEDLIYLDSRIFGESPNQYILNTPPRSSFPKGYFCNKMEDSYCFYDYSHKGSCEYTSQQELVDEHLGLKMGGKTYDPTVLDNTTINEWYGYEGRYGTDDLLDYQPLLFPNNANCRDEGSLSDGNVKDMATKMRETYSTTSVCAISTIFKGGFGEMILGQATGCYKARCGEDNKLRITLQNTDEQICAHEGQKLYMKGSMQHIKCPNPAAACATLPKTKMVTVMRAVPDRGPHDGKNFVMLEGFNLLKYDIKKISIGPIPINTIIEKTNTSILVQMPDDIKEKTKTILTKPQKLIINCEGEGQPNETVIEDIYTFLNRDY